jgi:two-component system, NtrC family, response regulator HydG
MTLTSKKLGTRLSKTFGVSSAWQTDVMTDLRVSLIAIDDDPQSLALVSAALEQDGLEITTEEDPVRGVETVRKLRPRIVLVDLMMPGLSGLEVLDRIMEIDPTTEVILMTSHYSTESAVQAIQRGACDYFNKPIDICRLQERIERLISETRNRQRARLLDRELLDAHSFGGIIGRSPLMLDVFARVQRVAPHFRSVLIGGQSGTGKEMVARAIHRLSPVAAGPLVVCNCAAIPENLVESELFGHIKGAFTGAVQDKPGLFEHANQGILFLDEIGEMPLAAQAKLLRAVQHQEVQRIGASAVRRVNVRIIAASNRDLRTAAREKTFREDLYFRLSMVEIKLPSLADRRDDLPLLMRHFVDFFARQYKKQIEGLTRRAEARLLRHDWPGNVRELENVIGYACMMTDSDKIDIHDLPENLASGQADSADGAYPLISVEAMGKLHAHKVLELAGRDKAEAARILDVSRATLYRLLA